MPAGGRGTAGSSGCQPTALALCVVTGDGEWQCRAGLVSEAGCQDRAAPPPAVGRSVPGPPPALGGSAAGCPSPSLRPRPRGRRSERESEARPPPAARRTPALGGRPSPPPRDGSRSLSAFDLDCLKKLIRHMFTMLFYPTVSRMFFDNLEKCFEK